MAETAAVFPVLHSAVQAGAMEVLLQEDLGAVLPGAAAPVADGDDYSPVSYTHLDVYKRQLLCC